VANEKRQHSPNTIVTKMALMQQNTFSTKMVLLRQAVSNHKTLAQNSWISLLILTAVIVHVCTCHISFMQCPRTGMFK
jgi:hypothetical protein